MQPDEIITSAYTLALYLAQRHPEIKTVYVIGEEGITHELGLVGIKTRGGPTEDLTKIHRHDLDEISPQEDVQAVVVGFDVNINYRKLTQAHLNLTRIKNCLFFATNDDTTYPAQGILYPGTGSLLASLITSTNMKPVVVGKPNLPTIEAMDTKYQLNPQTTCMVGDRLDTDIQFGRKAKYHTLLVLTGIDRASGCYSRTKLSYKASRPKQMLGHCRSKYSRNGSLIASPT